MGWARIDIVNLNDVKEFQKVLDTVDEVCKVIHFRKKDPREEIGQDAFIWDTGSKYVVLYKPGLQAKQYVFDKDGKYLIQKRVKDVVSAMSRSYKIQRTEDIMGIHPDKIESAEPLLYKNMKYDGKATRAYCYDLKSAYAQMLKLPLPDIRTAQYDVAIGDNQVGFYAIGEHLYCSFEKGKVCQYVFDLMDSPYVKWIDKVQKRIDKAETVNEKEEIKFIYRAAVGDLQNLNPFWRCIVVERCNQLVKSYIDDNTVYCNTDSLVSETPRDDILADPQFKWVLKRSNEVFKWQHNKENYQWNDEIPSYKGPKKRYIQYYNMKHDKPWDILTDPIPDNIKHKYNLNKQELKIYEETEDDWKF